MLPRAHSHTTNAPMLRLLPSWHPTTSTVPPPTLNGNLHELRLPFCKFGGERVQSAYQTGSFGESSSNSTVNVPLHRG